MRASVVFVLLALAASHLCVRAHGQVLERVVQGLDVPIAVTTFPGNSDIYVVADAATGLITLHDTSIVPAPGTPPIVGMFLDLSQEAKLLVSGSPDTAGISGIGFHPEFLQGSSKRFFYVRFNAVSPSNETVIRRYFVRPGQIFAHLPSAADIFRLGTTSPLHSGGNFALHKAGPSQPTMLYFSTGDQVPNSACAVSIRAQDSIEVEYGKAYSLDVDSFSGSLLPATMLALGMRNPFYLTVDQGSPTGEGRGDIFISDTGQDTSGSILRIPSVFSGVLNFAFPWRVGNNQLLEGVAATLTSGPCFSDPNFGEPSPPPSYADHSRVFADNVWFGVGHHASLSGAVVYRGGDFPSWQGRLIHGIPDSGGGVGETPRVFLVNPVLAGDLPWEGVSVDLSIALGIGSAGGGIMPNPHTMSTLTQDHEGELLIASFRPAPGVSGSGIVYRVVP